MLKNKNSKQNLINLTKIKFNLKKSGNSEKNFVFFCFQLPSQAGTVEILILHYKNKLNLANNKI